MIRIRTGLFGVTGLLLGLLPTVAAASVSKPTAEERGACMGDALSLCIAAIPNKARIGVVPGVEDVAAQPPLPGAIRQGGRPPITRAKR